MPQMIFSLAKAYTVDSHEDCLSKNPANLSCMEHFKMSKFTNRSSIHYTSSFTKAREQTDPHDPLSFKSSISVSLKHMQPTPRKAACSGFAPLHLYPCPLHENSTLHNNQQQHPLRYSFG